MSFWLTCYVLSENYMYGNAILNICTVECTSVKLPWRLFLKFFINIVFVLIGKSLCKCPVWSSNLRNPGITQCIFRILIMHSNFEIAKVVQSRDWVAKLCNLKMVQFVQFVLMLRQFVLQCRDSCLYLYKLYDVKFMQTKIVSTRLWIRSTSKRNK